MLLPILTHTHPILLYLVILMDMLGLTDDFIEGPPPKMPSLKTIDKDIIQQKY